MIDRYTKIVLTIIALAMTAIAIQSSIGTAQAQMADRMVCEVTTDNGADLDQLATITGKGMTIAEAIRLKVVCDGQ